MNYPIINIEGEVIADTGVLAFGKDGNYKKRTLTLKCDMEMKDKHKDAFYPCVFDRNSLETIEGVGVGAVIKVVARLNGTKWKSNTSGNEMYFLNIECFKCEIVSSGAKTSLNDTTPDADDTNLPF